VLWGCIGAIGGGGLIAVACTDVAVLFCWVTVAEKAVPWKSPNEESCAFGDRGALRNVAKSVELLAAGDVPLGSKSLKLLLAAADEKSAKRSWFPEAAGMDVSKRLSKPDFVVGVVFKLLLSDFASSA
jgi:hypothetical protein